MTRISVVVPLYNKAGYIRRTVESVLHQTIKDLDLIVVDDGSTDGSDRIVEEIDDPRLLLVRRPNGGQNAARNMGINHAKSDFIAFLDADDTWQPEFLEAMLDLRQRYPDAGLYGCGYRIHHHNNLFRDVTLSPEDRSSTQILIFDYFRRARLANFVCSSAVAIAQSVFSELGLFLEGEHRGGDREMWARIALRYPIAYDCRLLANYRADATGRENPRKERRLQIPPFTRTAKRALETDQVSPSVIPDINEYVTSMWLDYVTNCRDNRKEVLRVLGEEVNNTEIYKREVFLLKWGSRLLPMSIFQRLRRISKSRRLGVNRLEQSEAGVVVRVHYGKDEANR